MHNNRHFLISANALFTIGHNKYINKQKVLLFDIKQLKTKLMKNDIDLICNIVCGYQKIPVAEMKKKSRKSEIITARQLCMELSSKHTKASLATIGYLIGEKDHATVLHAKKTVSNRLDTEKRYRINYNTIEKEIKKAINIDKNKDEEKKEPKNNDKVITVSKKGMEMRNRQNRKTKRKEK